MVRGCGGVHRDTLPLELLHWKISNELDLDAPNEYVVWLMFWSAPNAPTIAVPSGLTIVCRTEFTGSKPITKCTA